MKRFEYKEAFNPSTREKAALYKDGWVLDKKYPVGVVLFKFIYKRELPEDKENKG